MSLKATVKSMANKVGYEISKHHQGAYDQDCLWTINDHSFMQDPRFIKAYNRAVRATNFPYPIHWRLHVVLWVADHASKLDGDFVECGVSHGWNSSAIMEHLNWNSFGKQFYLLDTFKGIDDKYITEEEEKSGILNHNSTRLVDGTYVNGVESVAKNFSEWKNVKIIVGSVPETLPQIDSDKIAYVHLDMNCAPPEVAAFNFLWEKMVKGAIVLLDDYAFPGHGSQRNALDAAAQAKGTTILSLPTGQGMLIKS